MPPTLHQPQLNRCIPKEQLGPHHVNFQHPQGQGNYFPQWLNDRTFYIYIYTVYTSYLQLFLLLCSSCCFFGMSSWPLLVIRGEMGIHLQVKILRAIMGKYPQHWLAKSCMDHFGRRKLRTYQKLICLSPFTPASVNKDDPCHDILVGFIAVSTRYGKIRILALLLNSIHGWKVEKVLGWSLWLCGGSP